MAMDNQWRLLARKNPLFLIGKLGCIGMCLGWLGLTVSGQNMEKDTPTATSSLNQALARAQALLTEDPDSSLSLARRVEAIGIKEALPLSEGLALRIQAQAHFALAQPDSALTLFQQSATRLLVDSLEMLGLYQAIRTIAWEMLSSRLRSRAEPFFALALELTQEPYLANYGPRAIADYGACLISQGKLTQGVDYLTEQRPFIEAARDTLNLIRNHLNLALAYKRLGAYRETLEQYQAALHLQSAAGEIEDMMLTHNRRGRLYQDLGRFGQALNEYQQSQALADSLGQPLAAADALSNLGTLYAKHGDYAEAWAYYQQAKLLYVHGLDSVRISVHFIRLGNWHFLQGGLDSASYWYQRSLNVETKLLRANGIATAYTNLGSVYARKRQFLRALDYYEKAFDLQQANENRFELPSLLINLANLEYDLGRYARAESHAQRGLRLA
ncbi:MAG: tetratricopeptide repeat protein, partial [Bacteroidota bacterium]